MESCPHGPGTTGAGWRRCATAAAKSGCRCDAAGNTGPGGAQPQQQAQQAGGGGGRGGVPTVPPGTYLSKVMIGDRVIGQKTVIVEADTTFMQ